jgi:ferritin
VLEPLDAPQRDWSSVVDVWQSILQAEQTNTQNLLRLAALANECGDYGSAAFLNPFHVEQIEAEDKVGTYLTKIASAAASSSDEFLMQIDHQLALEAEEEAAEHGH